MATVDLVFSTDPRGMKATIKQDATERKQYHNGILVEINLDIKKTEPREQKTREKIDYEDEETIRKVWGSKFHEVCKYGETINSKN